MSKFEKKNRKKNRSKKNKKNCRNTMLPRLIRHLKSVESTGGLRYSKQINFNMLNSKKINLFITWPGMSESAILKKIRISEFFTFWKPSNSRIRIKNLLINTIRISQESYKITESVTRIIQIKNFRIRIGWFWNFFFKKIFWQPWIWLNRFRQKKSKITNYQK